MKSKAGVGSESKKVHTVRSALTTLTSMIRRRLKSLQFTSAIEGLLEPEGSGGASLDSSYLGSFKFMAEQTTSHTQGLFSNRKSWLRPNQSADGHDQRASSSSRPA